MGAAPEYVVVVALPREWFPPEVEALLTAFPIPYSEESSDQAAIATAEPGALVPN